MSIIRLNDMLLGGALFADHGADDHVMAYIPTRFSSNHASSLTETEGGDILCVWFAGLTEGASDISIAFSRLNRGADRWTEPVLLSDDPLRSEQNPSIFAAPDGALWLLHTAQLSRGQMTGAEWEEKVKRGEAKGHFTMQETSEVRLRKSFDGGYTWDAMRPLFTKPGAFCRHPVQVLSNGDWIFPMWYSVAEDDPNALQYGSDYSVVQISTDRGETWTEYPVPGSKRRVHMSIVETEPGRLLAFFRSRAADAVYRSESTDFGRTWSEPRATDLPNNNASIKAIRLRSGAIALAFNACRGGTDPDVTCWPKQRSPLMLALSDDGGETFPYMRVLEAGENFAGEANRHRTATYHYPSVIQSRDGAIHVSYTYHGSDRIKYHRITEDWIRG